MNAQVSTPELSAQVVAAIRSVVGERRVALHEPQFAGNELAYLKECVDSTFVSSVGRFVDRFESDLCAYTGARHAIAVVNGTAALHVALGLAGVRPGDEVLVPALTFVATANAVEYCSAVPHFVDSDMATLGVDGVRLRAYLDAQVERRGGLAINRDSGRVIRALVPMHTFGHPVDMDDMLAIGRDFGMAIVEDATESLGSRYGDRHTGTMGRLGTLSFNGNKIITTGGGGAILTDDPVLARRAKHLTTTAKLPHAWEYRHDEVGYNYRMPNLNAALGCAQLERLPEMLAAKRELHRRYRAAFAPVRGLSLVEEPAHGASNFWLQAIMLDADRADERDRILAATNEAGFMTRPAWTLMHELAPFATRPRMGLPVAEALSRRLVNIPSSATLDAAA